MRPWKRFAWVMSHTPEYVYRLTTGVGLLGAVAFVRQINSDPHEDQGFLSARNLWPVLGAALFGVVMLGVKVREDFKIADVDRHERKLRKVAAFELWFSSLQAKHSSSGSPGRFPEVLAYLSLAGRSFKSKKYSRDLDGLIRCNHQFSRDFEQSGFSLGLLESYYNRLKVVFVSAGSNLKATDFFKQSGRKKMAGMNQKLMSDDEESVESSSSVFEP